MPKQIIVRCDDHGEVVCVPVDVLAQYGQWCVTHPVYGTVSGSKVGQSRFTVTHEHSGYCVKTSTGEDKALAVAIAKALKPFEFYSIQDPMFRRDRPAMVSAFRYAILEYEGKNKQ